MLAHDRAVMALPASPRPGIAKAGHQLRSDRRYCPSDCPCDAPNRAFRAYGSQRSQALTCGGIQVARTELVSCSRRFRVFIRQSP